MNYSMLLDEALVERGNAVLVIARPAEAERAVIENANRLFARMVGQPVQTLVGRSIESLRGVVADSEAWASFVAALRSLEPVQLDMRLQLSGVDSWLGFGLSFKADTQEAGGYGILIGQDITLARRTIAKDTESQRLLAAMFLRTSAALLVVRPDGGVVMANPAFQHLLGFAAEDIPALNARDLTSGKSALVAQAARAKQLRDGAKYEICIETVGKNGVSVPVRLTSVLVQDSSIGSLRVVTLIPDSAAVPCPTPSSAPSSAPAPAPSSAPIRQPAVASVPSHYPGQLRAISLAAFKTAFAEAWPRVAPRAMLMAEHIIRGRLSAADVFNRSGDHGFVIWFDSSDFDRNATVLARAAREIKLRLLSEFGEEIAVGMSAVVVGDADTLPAAPSVKHSMAQWGEAGAMAAPALEADEIPHRP